MHPPSKHSVFPSQSINLLLCLVQVLRALLQAGANVNACNPRGKTALHYAAYGTHSLSIITGSAKNCVMHSYKCRTGLSKAVHITVAFCVSVLPFMSKYDTCMHQALHQADLLSFMKRLSSGSSLDLH